MKSSNFMIRRKIFSGCAIGIGSFLAVVAFWAGGIAIKTLFAAYLSSGADLKDDADSCAKLFGIAGIAGTGVLYLVRWVFQREFDSAVEFAVIVTPLGRGSTDFELLAKLKNILNIGAGIDSLTFRILDAKTGTELLNRTWDKPPGRPPILTRNTTWQLAHRVTLPEMPLYKLIAVCRIGLQPDEQAIYFEEYFPKRTQ